MRLAIMALAMAGGVWAQSAGDLFSRPPAGVDEQVRERVTQYFTLQMEGKFRQAESLVCEGGRDAYYDMEKTRWKSFEIIKTSYEDDFRTAKAVVLLGTTMNTPHGVLDAKFPYVSTWKLEGNQFCFFIDPERAKSRETPFGTMIGGPGDGKPGSGGAGFVSQEQILATLRQALRVSPETVRLSSFEKSSARVEIVNALQGLVDLEVTGPERKGLNWKLESAQLEGGKTTHLVLNYDPPDKSPKERMVLQLRVSPSGHVIPLTVEFSVPEAVMQALPAAAKKPE